MTDIKLTLGAFEFARFEVPETITFGGDQQLTIHQLVGGTRIIDAMGETPLPLKWSGHLVGASALDRALYLDRLRKAGNALALTWSELSFTVVIKTFECSFVRSYRLQYSITCEVVADRTSPITTITAPSFEQAVADDQATADALAARIGNNPLVNAVAAVRTALGTINNLVTAARSEINAVLQPIQDARGAVSALLTEAAGTLQSVSTVGGVFPNNPIAAQANNLSGQIAGFVDQANLVALDRTLGRMANNLSQVTAGTKSVTVAGGNLFAIAATEYGDPMGWTALAVANRMTDPQIAGLATLEVPPFTNDTGGILNA